LGNLARQFGRVGLPERGGINQVRMPRDDLGEGRLTALRCAAYSPRSCASDLFCISLNKHPLGAKSDKVFKVMGCGSQQRQSFAGFF